MLVQGLKSSIKKGAVSQIVFVSIRMQPIVKITWFKIKQINQYFLKIYSNNTTVITKRKIVTFTRCRVVFVCAMSLHSPFPSSPHNIITTNTSLQLTTRHRDDRTLILYTYRCRSQHT